MQESRSDSTPAVTPAGSRIASRSSTRRFRWLVGALLALHVAKALVFFAGGQAPLKWDSLEYWGMARDLAAGNWLEGSRAVHRPPGYPAFLALHQLVFGRYAVAAVVLVQLALVVVTAWLTGWMCGAVARSRAAFAVGLAAPLAWMEFPYLSLYLLSDGLLCGLFAGYAALVVAWMERPSVARATATGLLLGAAILVKPVAQLAWLPLVLAMIYRLRQTEGAHALRRTLAHVGALAATLVLALGPWCLRNQAMWGEAFLTKFSGRVLWTSCFNPAGAGLDLPDTPAMERVRAAAGDVGFGNWSVFRALVQHGYSPPESDDLMLAAARDAIAANPLAFAASVLKRSIGFWTTPKRHGYWRNNELLTDEKSRPVGKSFEIASVARWHARVGDRLRVDGPLQLAAPLLALIGLLGLARTPRLRPLALVLGATIAYLMLTVAAAILPMYRYRIPVDPLVITCIVAGGFRLVRPADPT